MENSLKAQLEEAINESAKFEYYIEENYCEEDVINIHSLLSYMVNQFNDFGHLNDENIYNELKNNNEHLFDEAKKWFEFTKKCIILGNSLRKLKRQRRKTIWNK